MFYNLATISGVLVILYGLILLTRRKFMVKRGYLNIFIFFMSTLNPTIKLMEMGYGFPLLFIGILLIFALVIIISRGRYTLTNINEKMVSSTLIDILEEKNLSYEEDKNTVILEDYDSKQISYRQSLNSVEINLTEILTLPFYKELKVELRTRIKAINLTVFPTLGCSLIILGAIFLMILQYL